MTLMMMAQMLMGLFWGLPGVIIEEHLVIVLAKIKGLPLQWAAAESKETPNDDSNGISQQLL